MWLKVADEPWYSTKDVATPKASQPKVSTWGLYKLRVDSVICTTGQVLLMSPSVFRSDQGIQRPILQLTLQREFRMKAYHNCKEMNMILTTKMKMSFIK